MAYWYDGAALAATRSPVIALFRCLIKFTTITTTTTSYLNSHNLCNTCQSAYRPSHSTETALLKVANDLFLSLNIGNIFVLALLDSSSAFDTVDHPILVHRLHADLGFTDAILQWFRLI